MKVKYIGGLKEARVPAFKNYTWRPLEVKTVPKSMGEKLVASPKFEEVKPKLKKKKYKKIKEVKE